MYKVGDYIFYGSEGVCKIEGIGTMDVLGIPKDRVYYTLVHVYKKGSKVFTPVDNNKAKMRTLISRDEAENIINGIKDIETLWINDEKQRESMYKETMYKYDCREWIKIIKTIYLRKQSRIAQGKKVTASDKKYLEMAEDNLYSELAIALGMKKEQVEEFIIKRVGKLENITD